MEESIFPAPAVAEVLKSGFIEARIHNDHHVDELKENARELQVRLVKSIGAPMYAIVNPNTEEVVREGGYGSEEYFLGFLRGDEAEGE